MELVYVCNFIPHVLLFKASPQPHHEYISNLYILKIWDIAESIRKKLAGELTDNMEPVCSWAEWLPVFSSRGHQRSAEQGKRSETDISTQVLNTTIA